MATFTANSNLGKDTNKKDWAYHLGCLPLTDHIVFTKQSLLEFLKTKGVSVSPNYSELNRLPQYATVGNFSSDPSLSSSTQTLTSASTSTSTVSHPISHDVQTTNAGINANTNFNAAIVPVRDASGDAFRPTRRVREAIGGGSDLVAASLFGGASEQEEDVGSLEARRAAPSVPAPAPAQSHTTVMAPTSKNTNFNAAIVPVHDASGDAFRPTRRVREAIGGGSDLVAASLFGGAIDESDDQIAPVRGTAASRRAAAAAAQARAFADAQHAAEEKENAAPRYSAGGAVTQADLEMRQKEEAQEKNSAFRPTRRVREAGGTGGASSIVLA